MGAAEQSVVQRGAGANLALATTAFAVTFWAWNLIGPLSKTYSEQLDLTRRRRRSWWPSRRSSWAPSTRPAAAT